MVENKYYGQNIGEIKAEMVKGGSEVETLVQIENTVMNITDSLLEKETPTPLSE